MTTAGNIQLSLKIALLGRTQPAIVRKVQPFFGCAISIAYGTIDNVAKLKLGDNIVIYGAGGVGLSIIEAANLAGARKIIAVDKFDNRLDLAGQCSATDCHK